MPSSDETECLFCFDLCQKGSSDVIKMCRNHMVFVHTLCLDKWLLIKNECPLCKIPLRYFPYGQDQIPMDNDPLLTVTNRPPRRPRYTNRCTSNNLFRACIYLCVGLIMISVYIALHV